MENYLVYKDQIEGFREVGETVKTVEKIAAASISRLRQDMANIDAYQANIGRILTRLSLFHEVDRTSKVTGVPAIIVLTSDKGLTGGLWRRTIDTFLTTARQKYEVLITVGSRGEKYLKEEAVESTQTFGSDADALRFVTDGFRAGRFVRVDILYPKFMSLAEHRPTIVPFLPFSFDERSRSTEEPHVGGIEYGSPIVEPMRALPEIFERLMRKYIDAFFQQIAAEGKLSEFSARTVSMEHASAKTDELIKGLVLGYRTEHRRSLTQKQLESFIAHKIV
jgi:ATP synthase F1 gamma subunit